MAGAGLSTREYGGHVVVALHGELDIADSAGVTAVLTAAATGNPRIIIDLAALEYIDCCALGALVRVRAQAGTPAVTCCSRPRGPVRRLLDLTGLTASSPSMQRGRGGADRRMLPPRGNRRVTGARGRPVMNPRGRVSWRGAVLSRAGGLGLARSGWWSAR